MWGHPEPVTPQVTNPSHKESADTSLATPQATATETEKDREGLGGRPMEPKWPEWTLVSDHRHHPAHLCPVSRGCWEDPWSRLQTPLQAFAQHLCLDTLAMRRQSCPALRPMASVSTGMRGQSPRRKPDIAGRAGLRPQRPHRGARPCTSWALLGSGSWWPTTPGSVQS